LSLYIVRTTHESIPAILVDRLQSAADCTNSIYLVFLSLYFLFADRSVEEEKDNEILMSIFMAF
jgi:hypothetical protein